jgi:hypothetical protein
MNSTPNPLALFVHCPQPGCQGAVDLLSLLAQTDPADDVDGRIVTCPDCGSPFRIPPEALRMLRIMARP